MKSLKLKMLQYSHDLVAWLRKEIPLNSVLVLITPLAAVSPLFSVTDTGSMCVRLRVSGTGLPGGPCILTAALHTGPGRTEAAV